MRWDHPNPFTLPTVAQSHDIDGLNHTNNARALQDVLGNVHRKSDATAFAIQYGASPVDKSQWQLSVEQVTSC